MSEHTPGDDELLGFLRATDPGDPPVLLGHEPDHPVLVREQPAPHPLAGLVAGRHLVEVGVAAVQLGPPLPVLRAQLAHRRRPARGRAHTRSRAMSRIGEECVRPPTLR